MKRALTSLLLLACVATQVSAAGLASYWTISVLRVVIPEGAAIHQVSLHIRGAERVLVGNLPAHWGVVSTNNMTGEFWVVLTYVERDFGAAFSPVPLSRILAGVEITSGPPFSDADKHGDDFVPDRSAKIDVSGDILFIPKFDPKDDRRQRKSQFQEIPAKDFDLLFHDIEVISGAVAREEPNQSSFSATRWLGRFLFSRVAHRVADLERLGKPSRPRPFLWILDQIRKTSGC